MYITHSGSVGVSCVLILISDIYKVYIYTVYNLILFRKQHTALFQWVKHLIF